MLQDPIVVTVMAWDEALAHARPIRVQVFVAEQGVPLELEWDADDAVAEHAVAFDAAGFAVATGRLLPDGHIGRMAVLRTARGRGIGGRVLETLIERARARRMRDLVLSAQVHAAAFYARFGFEIASGEYMEAGIAHVEMRRSLG